MITLHLLGPFRLCDDEGSDITPKAIKARGVLALLSLSPGMSRTRGWIQDKLWSDRNRKQGSDSLRQVLMGIRHTFRKHPAALRADRERIWLDPEHFQLSFQRPAVATTDDLEIFSDLDVADPEFEDWIRDRRIAGPTSIQTAKRQTSGRSLRQPMVFLRLTPSTTAKSREVAEFIGSRVTNGLLDIGDFVVFRELVSHEELRLPAGGCHWLHLFLSVMEFRPAVIARILAPDTGRVLWSREFILPRLRPHDLEDVLTTASAEIIDAITRLWRDDAERLEIADGAMMLAHRARQLIFRYDQASLADADRYLTAAYELEARPQFLAWRAFLRNLALFQRPQGNFLGVEAEISLLAHEALRQAPTNSHTLAVAAHIEYLAGGSHRNSRLLATRALSINPASAFNHAILSNTELVMGSYVESRALALRSLSLAHASDAQALMEFFCCMSAAATEDYAMAIAHAEMALALRPRLMAPLRYLVVLYKQVGLKAKFDCALRSLQRAEPDFDLGRFADMDYPVTTLRRMRLIEAVL